MNKKLLVSIAAIFVLTFFRSEGQVPGWNWEATATFLVPGSGSSVGSGRPKAWDMLVDENNTSYIVGQGAYSIHTGGNNAIPAIAGMDDEDIIVTKYSSTGAYIAGKRFGGMKIDGGFSIGRDKNGFLYISGQFQDSAKFDNIRVKGSARSIFVAKLDTNLNALWVRVGYSNTPDPNHDIPVSLSVDGQDNIIIHAILDNNNHNGIFYAPNKQLAATSGECLVKYNSNGNLVWIANGIPDLTYINPFSGFRKSTAADANGNIFVAGTYTSGYLAKYDSSGSKVWEKTYTADCQAVCTDKQGNAYVTGSFVTANTDFGGIVLTPVYQDPYIFKITTAGTVSWVKSFGGIAGGRRYGQTIITDDSSNVYVVKDGPYEIYKYTTDGTFRLKFEARRKKYNIVDFAFDSYLKGIAISKDTKILWACGFDDDSEYLLVNFTSALNAPTNLVIYPQRVEKTNSGSLLLSWTDNSGNETGFKIEKSDDGVNGWALLDTTAVNINYYTETGLPDATTYYYRVSAYNAGGSSAFSNVVNATTLGIIAVVYADKHPFIFPNPAANNLSIDLSGFKGTTTVSIFNLNGQVLYSKMLDVNNSNSSIIASVGNLAQGVYFVSVKNGNEINLSKFIKE